MLFLLAGAVHGQGGTPPPVHAKSAPLPAQKNDRSLPLVFEANQGQFAGDIGFVGRTERYSVAIGPKDLRFSLPGAHGFAKVVLSLRDSQASAPVGITEAPFRTNYFLGSDPAGYRTGVRNYTRVGLEHVYPGVDAEFYTSGNTIEHDFLVAPGAEAGRIHMGIVGAAELPTLSPAGDVVIAAGNGELRLKKPVAYQQDAAGKRIEVAAAFVLTGGKEAPGLGFQLGDYDHSRLLVIDPVIVYGSFFDGKAGSTAAAVVADAAGDVYLAGSTNSASADFGVASASTSMDPSGVAASSTHAVAFVAKFNPVSAGATVAWLSYFGGTTGTDNAATSPATPANAATSLAITPTSMTAPATTAGYINVGGSTLATDFPTTTGTPATSLPAGVTRGFVASLLPSTGVIQYSTYVSSSGTSGNTAYLTQVHGVAADASGNIYAVGAASGPSLVPATLALTALPSDTTGTTQQGFLYELDPTLTLPMFATYLAGTPVMTTTVTGVVVDAAVPANIYVSGYTLGTFPLAGAYPPGTPYTAATVNPHAADGGLNDAFAAEVVPGVITIPALPALPSGTPTTIRFSTWISGTGDDRINALAFDQASTPNLYVFGQTSSAGLAGNATTPATAAPTYTYDSGSVDGSVTAPTAGSLGSPVTASLPGASSGFIAELGYNGQPQVLTYVGGAATDTITAGTVGANFMVYAAGASTSAKTMSYPSTTLLPAAEDVTGSSTQHGFLIQLPGQIPATTAAPTPPAPLSAVNYIANVGSSQGPDAAVGVTVDATPNAYLAANISTTAAPFTLYPGFELTKNATGAATTSAYLAEVASSPTDVTPTLTLAAVSCPAVTSPANPPVGCPDPIGYPVGGPAPAVTYTWSITPTPGSTTAFTNVEIQIPAEGDLTYSSLVLKDTTANTAVAGALCTPVSPAGATCLIPAYPQSSGVNDTITVTLNTLLKDQPTAATGFITVTANLYGPGPNTITTTGGTTAVTGTDSQTVSINSNVQAPANLTITAAAVPLATPAIFTTNSGVTSPNTLVGYTFTVTNTTAPTVGTATNATFTISLPTGAGAFAYNNFTPPTVAGGACTYNGSTTPAAITCTGLTIAAGSSVTVTVNGTYPDAALGLTSLPSFGVSASAFLSSPSITFVPATKLTRGVHLTVSSATLADTTASNPNGYYYLGNAVSYTVTVLNDGPSGSSGSDTLTVTLPASSSAKGAFTPDTSSPVTCNASNVCTANIPALAANVPGSSPPVAGSTQQFVITGKFQDASNTSVLGSAVSVSFSAATTLNTGLATDSNTGTAGDTTSSSTANVIRAAGVTVTQSSITPTGMPCLGGSTPCLYMLNAGTGDHAAYNFTLKNAGPDVALNTVLTILLPSAPANGGNHALVSGTPVPVTAITSGSNYGTPITCTYAASSTSAPAANVITCQGNLPVGTIQVTGSLTADDNTVPASVAYVTAAAGTAGLVTFTQNALGAPSPMAVPGLEVDRVAHLITGKTIALTGPSLSTTTPTVNLAENTSSSPGVNDTFTVTITVASAELNLLPSATLVDTLPGYFQVLSAPKATTVGGAGATCTVTGNPATSAAATLTCALTNVAPSVTPTPATQVTITYSGKFIDNGVTAADSTGLTAVAKTPQNTTGLQSAAVAYAALAADPGPASDLTSAAPALTVERRVQMLLTKRRNTSGTLKTVLDLDEEANTGNTTGFGGADELEFDDIVTNSGVNQALGIQVTDTFPPFFTVVNAYVVPGAAATPDSGGVPAAALSNSVACYAGTAVSGSPLTFPYSTGGAAQQITCTFGVPAASPANPLALAPAASFEFVYQGKFQDLAPNVDDVPLGSSSYAFSSAAGAALVNAAQSTDSGPTTERLSAALGPFTVNRAVHLTLVLPSNPVRSVDETVAPLSVTGEAEPTFMLSSSGVPVPTGGTPVFNCLRYKAYVQNAGPNIARQPMLSIATLNGLNLRATVVGNTTAPNTNGGTDAAISDTGCTYSSTIVSTGSVTEPGNAALAPTTEAAKGQVPSFTVDVDGYFVLNTLANANSLSEVGVSYTALSDASSVDTSGSTFSPVAGSSVTVTNTPTGSGFTVTPFPSGGGPQAISVNYGTVTAPGATNLGLSTTLPSGVSLPMGVSPVPGSSTIPVPLYTTSSLPTGNSSPRFYSVGTTAGIVSGSNTTVCVTSGGAAGSALPGIFAKPERVLLWDLLNLPAGTRLGSVPNVTTPYAGDITSQVLASGSANYVEAGGPLDPYVSNYPNLPALPPTQAQPQEVCGTVSGFATNTAQAVLAVLEPVNFAPVISSNPNSPSQTPGKGVSEVSFLFPSAVDYDNNDPCYVSTTAGSVPTRSRCDDNLVLTTWVFGGESLIPSMSHVLPAMTPTDTSTFVSTTFEVQAAQTLFYLVNDQLAEMNYANAKFCDAGAGTSYHAVANPALCPINLSTLSGTPPQEADFISGEIAELVPSLNGGSSALIVLPPGATPTSTSPLTGVATGYTAAVGTVTAGQTVGFQWRVRLDVTTVTNNLSPTGSYNLTCFEVAADLNTVIPFTAGLTCQVPSSVTLPTDPAIYIVTTGSVNAQNHAPSGWKGMGGVIFATLLVPFLLFRRRLSDGMQFVAVAFLLLGGALGLSGCGAGGSMGSPVATASGTYFFRVSATPVGGGATLTSTAFSVTVVGGS